MHSITLHLFASVREHIGQSQLTIEIPVNVQNIQQLKLFLSAQQAEWRTLFEQKTVWFSIDHELVTNEQTIIPHEAEIAIFPPVTGG